MTIDGSGKAFSSDLEKSVKGKSSLKMSEMKVLKQLPVASTPITIDDKGDQLAFADDRSAAEVAGPQRPDIKPEEAP